MIRIPLLPLLLQPLHLTYTTSVSNISGHQLLLQTFKLHTRNSALTLLVGSFDP